MDGTDARRQRYTAAVPSNFTADPHNPAVALDDLAARTATLEGAGGGGGGFVYITNIAPTGVGVVDEKVYDANTIPANRVLNSCRSDTSSVTVSVLIRQHDDAWQPASVTISGGGITPVPVTLSPSTATQVANEQAWTMDIEITGADTDALPIVATLSTGDTASCAYERLEDPPDVLSVQWDDQGTNSDPYPAIQTQFADGNLMQVSGTADAHADEVWIKDVSSGATEGQGLQGPYTVTAGNWTAANVVAGDADNATAHLVVYAKTTAGAPGDDFNSETDQAAATVACSQTSPSMSGASHAYPGTQEAIKDAETDTVTIIHTNPAAGDTYDYNDAGTGELTIPSSTTYLAAKPVSRLSGNYRESGTNYRLTITRTTKNGVSNTRIVTVKIAHVSPVVTVARNSGGSALNRMGSGSGPKNHTVYLISTQANLSSHTPTLAPDAGDNAAFTGSWSAGSNLYYTRSFQVQDADINAGGQAANDFTWGACSIKNRANKEATVVTTNTDYSLGGFTLRTVSPGPIGGANPPWTHWGDIGVPIVDTSKVEAICTSKADSELEYEANVTEHDDADPANNDFWTTVAALGSESFDNFTQFFHHSDRKFYASVVSGTYNCTITESET